MSRRGRDPAAPMPAQSAFLLYQDAMKDSLVRENPGLSLAELGKLAAGRFSTIPQRDKAVWEAHSEADKSRYYDELSAYVPAPGYNQNGDEIIHGMDNNAPLEPKTALMFFRDALREQFEAENPARDFQKLFARDIPHMFGSLSADEKAVWEMRAAQDQLRYETELATYESQTAQQLAANGPTGGLSIVTPNIDIANSNDKSKSKSKRAKKKKVTKTKSKEATTSTGKPRTKAKSKGERKERDPNAPKPPRRRTDVPAENYPQLRFGKEPHKPTGRKPPPIRVIEKKYGRKKHLNDHRHKRTGEPILTESVAEQVTECTIKMPTDNVAVDRHDIYIGEKLVGIRVLMSYEYLRKEFNFDVQGNSRRFVMDQFVCPDFRRVCEKKKKDAAGACAEYGYSSGNGVQTNSIRAHPGCKGNRTVPFASNLNESSVVEDDLAGVQHPIVSTIEELYPDLLSGEGDVVLHQTAATLRDTLTFPSVDGKKAFKHSQVALRLAGSPTQKRLRKLLDSKVGLDSAAKSKTLEWVRQTSTDGNATVHRDGKDVIFVKGVPMIYFCFEEDEVKHDRMRNNDLLMFAKPTGGRGVRVETMDPRYVCVIFCQSRDVHSNVYPDEYVSSAGPVKHSEDGIFGMRIVCYTTTSTFRLIESVNVKPKVMEELEAQLIVNCRAFKERTGQTGKRKRDSAAQKKVLMQYKKCCANLAEKRGFKIRKKKVKHSTERGDDIYVHSVPFRRL